MTDDYGLIDFDWPVHAHYCDACDKETTASELDDDGFGGICCYNCRLRGCIDDLCHGRGRCEH